MVWQRVGVGLLAALLLNACAGDSASESDVHALGDLECSTNMAQNVSGDFDVNAELPASTEAALDVWLEAHEATFDRTELRASESATGRYELEREGRVVLTIDVAEVGDGFGVTSADFCDAAAADLFERQPEATER